MVLHRLDHVLVHVVAIAGHAEGAVALVAARAAGDLADLVRIEPAHALAVELAQARERHVVDVHVQAHADGVGGHQEVDLARLVEGHLGVARARGKVAHHHSRPAPLAADQFGDGVDLLGREGDDGGAPGQTGQLLGAGVAQGRETLPRLDLRLGQEPPDQGRHGRGAQEHGLELAARVQQPLGEHMAALGVGAQLDLVHRQELHRQRQGHGLHRAHPVVRPRRDDLLLAGDQGHRAGAPQLGDAVIDLARQEAQRQADHAGGVAQHAFDRQMGFTRVGRSEDRDEARGRGAGGAIGHDWNVGDRTAQGKSRRPVGDRACRKG